MSIKGYFPIGTIDDKPILGVGVGGFTSATARILCDWITEHVVMDVPNADGLFALLTGTDEPITPPTQTVTVSVSGSTMNITGFTATTVTQSGSTLNVA